MRLNSTVLLSISDYRTRVAGPSFSCVLFGSEGEATYCYLLSTAPDLIETQINEYFELTHTIDPAIELLGLVFVGYGLDAAAVSVDTPGVLSIGSLLLLVDLSDSESAACRAFQKGQNDGHSSQLGSQWKPIPLQLVADQAVAIAVADSIELSSASSVHRAKLQLRNKIQEMRISLENEGDSDEASVLVAKYGQLKKMHFKNNRGRDVDFKGDDSTVLYELLAEVVAKSDERHQRLTDSAFSHDSTYL